MRAANGGILLASFSAGVASAEEHEEQADAHAPASPEAESVLCASAKGSLTFKILRAAVLSQPALVDFFMEPLMVRCDL